MRVMMLACAMGAAMAVLAACNSNSGPALPATPEGAQAPVELHMRPPARQADITSEERTQLEQVIERYLDAVQARMGATMHEAPGAPGLIVPMQPGSDHRWTVNLTAGAAYTFIAACDDDCSNVDFELIAPGGGVVASDLLQDDFPVATYTPQQSGQYIARLLMVDCSVAPCFAGARVLTNGAAPAAASSKP